MTRKNHLIAALIGLIVFSCERMEIVPSDQSKTPEEDYDIEDITSVPWCDAPDAAVSDISITNIAGNTVTYVFTVTNIGGLELPLEKMYFQTYLSTDSIFDASDEPAGGSAFSSGAPMLATSESYTQDHSFDTPLNMIEYHYLIVEVGGGPEISLEECWLNNNIRIEDLGCILPDGSISAVNFINIDPVANTFDYTFNVTNSGWGELDMNQMSFQAYVSESAVLGQGNAAPAGGAGFGITPPTLQKGETYTRHWYYHPTTPQDITVYKYLIIQLYVPNETFDECTSDNNTFVTPIVIDIPRSGLVAFYPFSGNANDESGNNLHGVNNGATSGVDRFGSSGGAYTFDGINDYMDMGNPVLLQFANTITLSAWVKTPVFLDSKYILAKAQSTNQSGTEGHGYRLQTSQTGSGDAQFYSVFIKYPGYGPNGLNCVCGVPFVTNEWTHLTFTLDGSNSRWYRNGVPVGPGGTTQRPLTAATLGNLNIGRGSQGGFYFTGQIDDVAIYNRALSETEVQQLYNQNITH